MTSSNPPPVLVDVRVEPDDELAAMVVTPVWAGVDRPDTYRIVVPAGVADRLAAAIRSGVALASAKTSVDADGLTYVAAVWRFGTRSLERDLSRLGA